MPDPQVPTSESSVPVVPGFKVVFFDHVGGPSYQGPETVVGNVTFSRYWADDDDPTPFTARQVAVAIWNVAHVLSAANLMVCGTCWAMAGEDDLNPVNCYSGLESGTTYEAVRDAWNALSETRRLPGNRVDTSLFLEAV